MGRDERISRHRVRRAPTPVTHVEAVRREPSFLRHIDDERVQLEAWLGVLRLMPACPGNLTGRGCLAQPCCDAQRSEVCRVDLHKLGEEILDFMSAHFARENTLMRRGRGIHGLRELFELHAEDHGIMMDRLVDALGMASPCEQTRALVDLLDVHMRRHLLTHDALLEEQLPRLCHEPFAVPALR